MISALVLSLGLLVPSPSVLRAPVALRASPIALCAPEADAGDLSLYRSAARVVLAAKQFGGKHAEAAAQWVDSVMSPTTLDGNKLLESQLELFEECIIDDEEDGGDKCKELDAALTELEGHLMAAAATTPVEGTFAVFGQGNGNFDRAAARVRAAAEKFGPEQAKAAAVAVAEVREVRAANPVGLLESQESLFGECLLDENGCSMRCKELQESLDALQASLGISGSVVKTSGLLPMPVEAEE